MKALVFEEKNKHPRYREINLQFSEGKELVEIRACALNHRDVWIMKGLYPGIQYPVIPGSDGAGIYQGQEVIINPSHEWGSVEAFQDPGYRILGLPDNGTFAEFVQVESKYLYPKPPHLSLEEAAALPLAGLTAYRALFTRARTSAQDRVLVTGAGGGVALFAIQFALALGCRVSVTSGHTEKINRAIEMGVENGVRYSEEGWIETLSGMNPEGFDVIIDGAGGPGLTELMKLCRPGGRIVIYGGTQGKTGSLNPQLLFWKQLQVMGSTMGSDLDFKQMIEFVNKYRIRPVVDHVFSLSEGAQAFDRMDASLQFGKIVMKP